MKKFSYITIFFILFLIFLTVYIENTTYRVIDITDDCSLVIDLNKNYKQNNDELFSISGIIPYCSVENIKSNDNISKNRSINEIVHLSVKTREFYKKLFFNSIITFDNKGNILVNLKPAQKILLNNGFAYTNDKKLKNEENFLRTTDILNNGKSEKYYLFNKTSRKYHNFDCPSVKSSKKIIVLSQKELPDNAKPCKYCLLRNENEKHRQTYNEHKIEDEYISTENIQIFHTFGAGTLFPSSKCDNKMCRVLLKEIENSKISIDIASYELFGVEPIINAIKNAKERGVKIRFVTDNSTLTKTFQNIKPEQIAEKVIDDGNSKDSHRLMHNKFFIFDDKKVWTGSANITTTSISGFNANTSLLIDSTEIAKIYKKEFENFINEKFHSCKEKVSNSEKSGNIQIYFSPKDNTINSVILDEIKNAKKNIYISAYIITHKNFTEEIINAHKRGVKIKVITDANSARNKYSTHKLLREANIPVKSENFAGTMHKKDIVIDGKTVITGSMNFTKSGEKYNDENTLVIKNREIAENFENIFEKIWSLIPEKYLKFDPNPESKESIGSCFDGVDNNYNGIIDRFEKACMK